MKSKPIDTLSSNLDSARENCEMEFRVGDITLITKQSDEETKRS